MQARQKFLVSVAACLALGAVRSGAEVLAVDSPFLAVGSRLSSGGPDGRNPELRGIMSGPDGTQYCIFDPLKKTSAWVSLQERGYSFIIAKADPSHDEVEIVTADGRKLSLVLRAAKVAANTEFAAAKPRDYSNLTPQQAQDQAAVDVMRDQMARKRMERLEATKAGLTAPPSPPPADPGA